jgi:phage-related tail protein
MNASEEYNSMFHSVVLYDTIFQNFMDVFLGIASLQRSHMPDDHKHNQKMRNTTI